MNTSVNSVSCQCMFSSTGTGGRESDCYQLWL